MLVNYHIESNSNQCATNSVKSGYQISRIKKFQN